MVWGELLVPRLREETRPEVRVTVGRDRHLPHLPHFRPMSKPSEYSPRRWYFMHRSALRNAHTDAPYMFRLQIVETPWFGIRFHRIHAPDPDRHQHDHPFAFLSFLLTGWYVEDRADRTQIIRWFNRCRAGVSHRIVSVAPKGATTLILHGPRNRQWGYRLDSGEWVAFPQYCETHKTTTLQ